MGAAETRGDLQEENRSEDPLSVFCFISPEGQEKKYFAARAGMYVFSVYISGSSEVVSPFTRKRKGHEVGQK